eukprot:g1698.t1
MEHDDMDLANLISKMAVGEPPAPVAAPCDKEHGADNVTPKLPTNTSDGGKRLKEKKRTAAVLCTPPDATTANLITGGSSGNALRADHDHRVRVDRAGRSPEHRKRMDDYIYQRLGFFRPLLFQENYVETLRSALQTYLRSVGDEVFSSAKVRLCGSWAAKLATRASDVNFTVLLQPNSLFAMLDAKKQEEQMKVDHQELRPLLAKIQVLHNRWKNQCDAIVRLEKARNEAARDVTRDGVKFKFPEKWSLSGVELEEFRQAAYKRREVLQDAERELHAALAGKTKACKAIAEWEESIPADKEDLIDRHNKLKNAIANLSSKYEEDVGELTYVCAQGAKKCGFEVLEVQTDGPHPFAKLVHPHLRTIDNKTIPVRIDVNNHHALLTARFVKAYVDMDPRIQSFLRFIRLWGGCRGVCDKDALNFQSHTVLALHFLLASGYVPSILPAHGMKFTPDHAQRPSYSYSSNKHHGYRGSRAGKFHDGIDYRFFSNRDAPEMPLQVFLAKRAHVMLERNVRQKHTSRTRDTDPTGMQGNQGEEGNAEDTDGEFEEESVGPQVLDGTKTPGQGSGSRSKAVLAPVEGVGVKSSVPAPRADEGGSGSDEPDDGDDATSKNGDYNRRGCKTSPTVSSPSPTPSHQSPELVGWSELLMIDLVLGYFRYYAHRRTGYEGRTFCHRSQVASLRPAVILPKTVWKGQTPEWRTSIEDAFKTFDARKALDLGNEIEAVHQARLHDEWNRGVSCAEGGTEMDIVKLLQSTGTNALDRIAYNLKVAHPQNGFYDTQGF